MERNYRLYDYQRDGCKQTLSQLIFGESEVKPDELNRIADKNEERTGIGRSDSNIRRNCEI